MRRIRIGWLFPTLALVLTLSGPEGEASSKLAWSVAPDDFVHYRIEIQNRSDSKLDDYARWGEIDDIAGFHGYELDDARRRVVRQVTHPELLYAPFVFTLPERPVLNARVTFDETCGNTWRLRAFRAAGQVTVVEGTKETGTGRVELAGEVVFGAPKDGSRAAYRKLREGRLTWRGTFDTARGLLEEVEYELRWTTEADSAARPPSAHSIRKEVRTCRAKVRLVLEKVLAHRYPGFQRDVDRAIEDGLRYLEEEQSWDGSWNQNFGATALALLALLDGGRAVDHPAIARGFKWLLAKYPWKIEQVPRRTYAIGIALMALERRRTPARETELRRRGAHAEILPRRLTGRERAWMARCVGFLLETARVENRAAKDAPVTGPVTNELWRWCYPRAENSTRFDNSNTQYAVLGLESAARCGIPVPRHVWYGIANHFLGAQAPSGRERGDLAIVYRRLEEPGRAQKPDGHRYAPEKLRARSRGWCYTIVPKTGTGTARRKRTYGSMTTAGIASLAIARGRLDDGARFRGRRDFLATIDQAILDGFSSLDDMFTVWSNPRYEGWYTYYLYGLERAGMLTGVRRFGAHDWYWEGAVQLLLRQTDYEMGSPRHWYYDHGSLGSTAWAILFLKRGTIPVITPR